MIQKVEMSEDLSEVLLRNIKTNLLKESSASLQVLTFYINMLKFWNSLDINYATLQSLTMPVKTYFLARPDALRCIIGNTSFITAC